LIAEKTNESENYHDNPFHSAKRIGRMQSLAAKGGGIPPALQGGCQNNRIEKLQLESKQKILF
jgi:hypothetical protein